MTKEVNNGGRMAVITIFTKNCGECPVKLDRFNKTYFCVLYKRDITDLTICECKDTRPDKTTEVFPRIKDLP